MIYVTVLVYLLAGLGFVLIEWDAHDSKWDGPRRWYLYGVEMFLWLPVVVIVLLARTLFRKSAR